MSKDKEKVQMLIEVNHTILSMKKIIKHLDQIVDVLAVTLKLEVMSEEEIADLRKMLEESKVGEKEH